ncbi:S-adenosyl-L-methionine-dependent methyltransferase, partial [Hygrophoropsis aurantiaca]
DHDGSDDGDGSSDTSSILTEIGPDEFADYFDEREGRLFHSHGDLPYPLPVDAPEQERLNDQHRILRDLVGNHYLGPVREVLDGTDSTKRVLDLCTGTGRWPMDMASLFPHVKFHGIDIVPIATRAPRSNVHFEMADVMQPFRYRDGIMDVVHARSVSLAVTDYPEMLREVARVLKPGGLFLSGEVARSPAFAPQYPFAAEQGAPGAFRFFQEINQMLLNRSGLQQIADKIPRWLQQSGQFTDITMREFLIPIGDWNSSSLLKRVGGEYRQAMERFADSMRPMLRSDDAIDEMGLEQLIQGYIHDLYHVEGMVGVYHTVWARKI